MAALTAEEGGVCGTPCGIAQALGFAAQGILQSARSAVLLAALKNELCCVACPWTSLVLLPPHTVSWSLQMQRSCAVQSSPGTGQLQHHVTADSVPGQGR